MAVLALSSVTLDLNSPFVVVTAVSEARQPVVIGTITLLELSSVHSGWQFGSQSCLIQSVVGRLVDRLILVTVRLL